MIGEILGNRYEIEEKIGEGGMSIVYKAMDNKLNRYVAVKVLKKEFSENEEIVRKFKREATAVANLADNNIVNILDVSSQDEINYLVMEYVKGKTLKDVVKQFGKIGCDAALTVGIQIAKALECAHKNNIIHRDIKPQNILVTEDGVIKVTDFGIAKSTTSATLSNTTTIMGSAHYFSPEQAKGSVVDNRTDIYSLGIVLYEMVTGKLPFDAESPVTIALKHLQEEPIAPKQINSKIPESLNTLIIKLLQKDPVNRYQTIKEVIVDLQKVKDDPNTKILLEEKAEDDHTIIMGALPISGTSKKSDIVNKDLEDEYYEDEEDYYDDEYYDEDEDKVGKKKSYKKLIIGGSIAAFLLVLGIVAFIFAGGLDSGDKGMVKVPDISGMTMEEAKKALTEAGLEYVDAGTEKSEEEEGIVIGFNPSADTEVEKGSKIRVVLSAGVTKLKMPNLVEETEKDAIEILDGLKLKNYTVEKKYSDDIEAGKVISTNPKTDEEVTEDTEITLYVSKGKETKYQTMPKVIGLDRDEAIADLTRLNLVGKVVGEVEVTDPNLVGKIAFSSHNEGTPVAEGTTIQLKIGKLKEEKPVEEKFFVDKFIKAGMDATAAKKALENAGFTSVVIEGDPNGTVDYWNPTEAVTFGTKITIFASVKEKPTDPPTPPTGQ